MASRSGHVLECSGCFGVLTGRKYVRHESRPYCIPCFEKDYAHRCAICEKLISADQKCSCQEGLVSKTGAHPGKFFRIRLEIERKEVSFKENFYHEICFSCSNCKSNLIERPFANKNNNLICMNCYEKMPHSKCCACGVNFKNGQVTLEFAGRHWHEECFRCKQCRSIISTDKFVSQEDGQLCASCFEKYCAPRCFKCNKIIIASGLKVNGTPWHSNCFVCQVCNNSLAKSTFVTKGCDFYCDSCYNEKFVKKCCQCNKPIKGADNLRCITFDGKNWHYGCFMCCRCEKSLSEKGFVMSDDRLMCPLCAQNASLSVTPNI